MIAGKSNNICCGFLDANSRGCWKGANSELETQLPKRCFPTESCDLRDEAAKLQPWKTRRLSANNSLWDKRKGTGLYTFRVRKCACVLPHARLRPKCAFLAYTHGCAYIGVRVCVCVCFCLSVHSCSCAHRVCKWGVLRVVSCVFRTYRHAPFFSVRNFRVCMGTATCFSAQLI